MQVVGAVASALHSAVLDDQGNLYTFGCGSDGCMGLKAYLKGSGQSRQRMKFYVSAPTVLEAFIEQELHVVCAAASRRHMVAAMGATDVCSNKGQSVAERRDLPCCETLRGRTTRMAP